jgi:hypothetical protein
MVAEVNFAGASGNVDAQHHHRMQQARRRIARNRRSLERQTLRLSHRAQSKIDWRLPSQRHPIAMLLGAIGVGMIASRLLSAAPAGGAWKEWLFRLTSGNLNASFFKQVFDLFRGTKSESVEADATADAETPS